MTHRADTTPNRPECLGELCPKVIANPDLDVSLRLACAEQIVNIGALVSAGLDLDPRRCTSTQIAERTLIVQADQAQAAASTPYVTAEGTRILAVIAARTEKAS